jgi:hypothetical protein
VVDGAGRRVRPGPGRGWAQPDRRVGSVGGTVVAPAVAAVVWAVRRQVLARPQPVLPPDQLAADDAIRSRSLHVLSGSGAALVGYAVLGQLFALWPEGPAAGHAYPLLGILPLVVPLLGWLVATSRWTVSRQAPAVA